MIYQLQCRTTLQNVIAWTSDSLANAMKVAEVAASAHFMARRRKTIMAYTLFSAELVEAGREFRLDIYSPPEEMYIETSFTLLSDGQTKAKSSALEAQLQAIYGGDWSSVMEDK